MKLEVRFATKVYEFVSATFDSIPTDAQYEEVKAFAEKHKNSIKEAPVRRFTEQSK